MIVRNLFFIVVAIFYSTYIFAQNDTVVIHPFSFETPSPEGWNTPYKGKVRFPDNNKKWEKILLIKTLKCDSSTKGDKYPCGEWDYITQTLIYVPRNDTTEPFQLISFVTPYGKRLWLGGEKGWSWEFDITDYAPILKGEMTIEAGNNQELLDLKFLFIEGTPVRNVLSVENLYPAGSYKYKLLADDSVLKPKKIILREDAKAYMLRARISGHGHFGPHNCCEWINKTHTYHIGDWDMIRWNVWKKCGFNPVYPQGGTWQFDRAGWCPGTAVDQYDFDITDMVKPGDTVLIDYSIENYIENGEKDGEYRMSHQLFSYGGPNFINDAAVIDIIAPSTKDKYSRINPVCTNPKIVIRNTGKNTLKTLNIRYGLKNGNKSDYLWCGNLEFMEKQEIILPVPDWTGLSENQEFVVEINNPNGTKDEKESNNTLYSTAKIPVVLPPDFIVHIQTNNIGRAIENSYTICNEQGQVIFAAEGFEDDTEYNHIINLKNGCYEFRFRDTAKDGMIMHWWNRNTNPDMVGKNGKITFLDKKGKTELYKFHYDFGQELILNFIVGNVP